MDIKNYQDKELKAYNLALFLIILCLILNVQFTNLEEDFSFVYAIISILGTGVSSIFTLVSQSILSSNMKQFIVRFPCYYSSGAYQIKKIKNNIFEDSRLDKQKIKNLHNVIDEGMRRSLNPIWYDLYYKVKDNSIIKNSHREFLITRDCCISTLMALLFYTVIFLALPNLSFQLPVVGTLSMLCVITNFGAKVKERQFAKNVIVIYIKNENTRREKF